MHNIGVEIAESVVLCTIGQGVVGCVHCHGIFDDSACEPVPCEAISGAKLIRSAVSAPVSTTVMRSISHYIFSLV